jgi:hypothetical protein
MRKAGVVLAAVVCISSPVDATTLRIRAFDDTNRKGTVTVRAGSNACTLRFAGETKTVGCRLPLPAGTTHIELDRDVKYGRSRYRGTQQIRLVDVAPLLGTLRDRTRPFGDRIRNFIAAKEDLEKSFPQFADAGAIVSRGDVHDRNAVTAAQKALGFELPAQHVEMITTVGALQVDDSIFEFAAPRNAREHMVKVWETPESAMRELPDAIDRFLRETVVLFTEVGDGYGALLYRPVAEKCGGGPAFYFVHQDGLAGTPHRITKADGSCGDYTDAVVWLMSRFVLERYDGAGSEVALIDRAQPGGLLSELNPYGDRDMKLTVQWE